MLNTNDVIAYTLLVHNLSQLHLLVASSPFLWHVPFLPVAASLTLRAAAPWGNVETPAPLAKHKPRVHMSQQGNNHLRLEQFVFTHTYSITVPTYTTYSINSYSIIPMILFQSRQEICMGTWRICCWYSIRWVAADPNTRENIHVHH